MNFPFGSRDLLILPATSASRRVLPIASITKESAHFIYASAIAATAKRARSLRGGASDRGRASNPAPAHDPARAHRTAVDYYYPRLSGGQSGFSPSLTSLRHIRSPLAASPAVVDHPQSGSSGKRPFTERKDRNPSPPVWLKVRQLEGRQLALSFTAEIAFIRIQHCPAHSPAFAAAPARALTSQQIFGPLYLPLAGFAQFIRVVRRRRCRSFGQL